MKNLKGLYVSLALAVASFVSPAAFSQPFPSPTFQNLTVLGTCTGCGGGGGGGTVTLSGAVSGSGTSAITTTYSGNLPVTNLNSGTGASASTAWFGDGTWKTPSGGGNVSGPGGSTNLNFACFSGTSGTVLADCGYGTSHFLVVFNNLSDVANVATARNNLLGATSGGTPTRYVGLDSGNNVVTGTPAGGGGTVGSGTTNQIAAYTASGTSVQGYTVANNCSAAISGSNINFTCSGGSSGLSGMTSGQLGVAGSAATITSSQAFSATPAANTIPETGGGNTLAAGFIPAINLAGGGAGGVTGILPVGNGGSGAATFTANAILKGAGASPFAVSSIFDAGGGVTIGSPTGGPQGVGTLNMAGCFINGVACATSSGGGVTWPASGDIVVSNATSSPAGIVPGTGVVSALAIAPNTTGGFALDGSSSNPTFGSLTVTSCSGCGGGGSTTIATGPGLGSSASTLNGLNGGSIQTVTNASTLSKQLGSVTKSASYVLNTVGAGDCLSGFKCDEARTIILGGTGEVITAPTPSGDLNGNYVILNPTSDTTATVVATGGSNFQYCLSSPAATLPIPAKTAVQITDNGSGYNCFTVPLAAGSGGSGITQLTGDVTAGPGSGSQAATVATGSNSTKGKVQCDAQTTVCPTGIVSVTAVSNTFTANHAIAATDMGGQVIMNGSSLTVTFPAISSTVLASGMSVGVINYNASPLTIATTPTINGFAGSTLAQNNGIFCTSNGTSLDCIGAGAAATGAGTGTNNTFTATNTFSGNVIPPHPAALTATGNLDPTSTNMCGGTVEYNSSSIGTLSILSSWPVGCNVSVTVIGTGLAIIAAGSGTVHTACATGGGTSATARAQYSTLWVRSSNTGGVGVVDVSGDCS